MFSSSEAAAVAETASQRRAPSRCSLMGGDWARAQAEMEAAQEKGRMVPARVFSRQMRRVGQAWMSVEVMVWALMSLRVRWWLLAGVTGMARAEERLARPPASLGFREIGC